jgi:hypothetical protein
MSWNMSYRRAALVAATAAALGTTAVPAQPAPPPAPAPPAATDSAAPRPGPGGGPPPWARHGMRDGHGHGHGHGMMQGRGMQGGELRGPLTGLVMRREDKAITGAEAVKIAEGFLLFMGERDWKIANPVETPTAVEFTLTTKDGSAIAKFSMDRKTGRVQRVG